MHRVVERKQDSAATNLTISAKYLESAIVHLRNAGVEFIHLRDLPERLASDRISKRRLIALTFDDGYRDNLTIAFPILRKYNVPATIFVPSGAPDRSMDVWFLRLERLIQSRQAVLIGHPALPAELAASNSAQKAEAYRRMVGFVQTDLAARRSLIERLMPKDQVSDEALIAEHFASWPELRRAAREPLLTIGGHTVTHPVLVKLSEHEAITEMESGKKRLTDNLDREIKLFSYPYGGRTECGSREYRLAKKVGFDLAVTTRYGSVCSKHLRHLHALPRITLGGLREDLRSLTLDVFARNELSLPRAS